MMKKIILLSIFGILFIVGSAQNNYWNLSGNAGTTKFNFIGTTDYNPLIFKTNNSERMRLLLDKAFFGG